MRPDPDQLQQWVLRDRLAPAAVGPRLGLSRAAGYGWLRRYGITPESAFVSQETLAGLWRAGRLARELAVQTGIPSDAVRERLVTAAVLVADRSYFVVGSPEDPLPEHLLRDWVVREGFTAAQVAALTGTTVRQVRYRLTRYRLSTGRPGPAPRLRRRLTREILVQAYEIEGLSCQRIAAREGISAESVRELLKEYGISRRPSGSRPRPRLEVAATSGRRFRDTTLEELTLRSGRPTIHGISAQRRRRPASPGERQPHRHQETLQRAEAAHARSAELLQLVRETMARVAATRAS